MRIRTAIFLALVCCASGAGAATPDTARAASLGQIQTAIQEPTFFSGTRDRRTALDRAVGAGTSWIKIDIEWNVILGDSETRPFGLVGSDPGDRHYNWVRTDALILDATARGLRPYFSIHGAPRWAERQAGGARGTNNPLVQEVADFFSAVASRYSGSYRGLPRVSAFEVWNEVNSSYFFMPQKDRSGNPVSPDLYRAMVNAASAAVHGVHPDNLVIAGGLFAFGNDSRTNPAIAPLRFMRQFLCMTTDLVPRAKCGPPVAFDVWSHHPYTEGSPTHATSRDAVSISGLAAHGRPPARGGRAGPHRVQRAASVLGHGVGVGQQPARPARCAADAARPLGVRGALPDVVRRRQRRDVVLPARRGAVRHRGFSPVSTRAARTASSATGPSRLSRPSGFRSWPSASGATCGSGAALRRAPPARGWWWRRRVAANGYGSATRT